jgi:2-phospho-L-lactate guanylyltransferase
MKPLADAKTRLWTDVPTLQREGVILMMLDTVARAASEALGPGACVVIGGDERVRQVAKDAGAEWAEDAGGGLNAALWHAMQAAYSEGCVATLFLPGDLPSITREDVVQIALASEDYTRLVGVRAEPDGGTNALLVPAAWAFQPQLGEDSFAKHVAAAEEVGTGLSALDLPRVAFDMDSFADMTWARANVVGFDQRLYDWQSRLHDARQG